MRNVLTIVLAVSLLTVAHRAEAVILYDAAAGTTPNEQGWFGANNPVFGAKVTQDVQKGVLTLNSSAVTSDQAGYFSKVPAISFEHPNAPMMNLMQTPFTIDFSMRLATETNVPDTDPLHFGQRNRGGFSVIAISEDLSGIELQFQMDNILALDNLDAAFPIGEIAAFDTSLAIEDYQLVLETTGYQLSTNGNLLLQGPLRDYSAIAPPAPFDFPYTTPSFLFFGDNTGRAAATTELARFAVSTLGDCSHDGFHNREDLACITTNAERDAVLAALGTLPGDLDGDGEVAFADFLILSARFGTEHVGYSQGNIDLVGDVGFSDFLILSANFGNAMRQVKTVPECHDLRFACLALGLAMAAFRRRVTSFRCGSPRWR